MIHEIKIAGSPPFWIESSLSSEEITAFCRYYNAARAEEGYMPRFSVDEAVRSRKGFMEAICEQHPGVKMWARTSFEKWLQENDVTAKWLWKRLAARGHNVLYSTVAGWVAGDARPSRKALLAITAIIKKHSD